MTVKSGWGLKYVKVLGLGEVSGHRTVDIFACYWVAANEAPGWFLDEDYVEVFDVVVEELDGSLFFPLDIELSDSDWLGNYRRMSIHLDMLLLWVVSSVVFEESGVCVSLSCSTLNLFWDWGLLFVPGGRESIGGLGLAFPGFALIHGMSDFWARCSFSLAVPYFSTLIGHLLASMRWLWSGMLFEIQFRDLRLWGHWPSSIVSIESPNSWAVMLFWQLVGSAFWCSFSS